jgi:prolyl-tRNA synthetase
MGMPMQIVVGGKGLKKGIVEVKDRRAGEKSELPVADLERELGLWRKKVWAGWNLADSADGPEGNR